MHFINIIVHIVTGSIALLSGIVVLIAVKGGKVHRLFGRIFLAALAFVILTGLCGVFVFHRNGFLLVITVLTGYLGFSGYRSLKLRNRRPTPIDNFIPLIALVVVMYFLWYADAIGMIWSPIIIYSTVGYLLFVVIYDLLRNLFSWNLWRYEHLLKMISAWSGLLSAFCGTVFPNYQPYSQFLPSVFGTLIAVLFILLPAARQRSRPGE